MAIKNFPVTGNKRITIIEETGEEVFSYITDADIVKSDFEEYRGLGAPSIDSYTINNTDIEEYLKMSMGSDPKKVEADQDKISDN